MNRASPQHNQSSSSGQIVLAPWDWRYHVGYDRKLQADIDTAIRNVSDEAQRGLLQTLFEWACTFVSLDAVLQRNLSTDRLVEIFDAWDERIQLPLSAQDVAYYRQRLVEMSSPRSALLESYGRAVRPGSGDTFKDLDNDFFRSIFLADDLSRWIAAAEIVEANPPETEPPLTDDAFRQTIQGFMDRRIGSGESRAHHSLDLSNVELSVQASSSGYAEYWPTSLTNEKTNRLVIYDNRWTRDRAELLGTLKHELFPGHGLFYAALDDLRPALIDQGAIVLVEGWATFAEWFDEPNPYTEYSRARAIRHLALLRCQSEDEVCATMKRLNQEAMNPAPFHQVLRHHRQYPGLTLSYVLGALWFEERCRNLSPEALLRFLLTQGAGDFFRLWKLPDTSSSIEWPEQRLP